MYKLLFLLLALMIAKFGDTNRQDLPICDKVSEAGLLLDTAQDYISMAKESIPRHCNGLPKYKVVCYYSSWSHYRKGKGKFDISTIDASLCTHIIYAFAKFRDNQIVVGDPYADLGGIGNLDGYKKFTDLKLKNPRLKTLLSIGGWSAGSETFSRMASDKENRTRFVESVVPFLTKHGFDGLDFDWEYPGSNGGSPEDKQNFVILLQMDYVVEKGLAGVMLWAIDTDDFKGDCYGKKWYLLNAVASRMMK